MKLKKVVAAVDIVAANPLLKAITISLAIYII